jgi:hypothetical protein
MYLSKGTVKNLCIDVLSCIYKTWTTLEEDDLMRAIAKTRLAASRAESKRQN